MTKEKPFRHQLKLSWNRVPLGKASIDKNSPTTSAENSNQGSNNSLALGPFDFHDSHEIEIDADGAFPEKIQECFFQFIKTLGVTAKSPDLALGTQSKNTTSG